VIRLHCQRSHQQLKAVQCMSGWHRYQMALERQARLQAQKTFRNYPQVLYLAYVGVTSPLLFV
jgi:hypothetical protein